jgi:6-hydroxytryprostatin B O-methyltransferase
MDLTMLETYNAKERDLDEWKALLAKADTRLKFHDLHQPPGSTFAIIEAVWDAQG